MGSPAVRRTAFALASLLALALLCATPAAAQSVNRNLIRELNTQLLYVALPLAVFVEVILLYAVIRFRNNPDPRPTIDSPNLEITWTAATGIILLFVGVSAYVVLGTPYLSPGAGAQSIDAADGSAAEGDAVVVRGLAYRYDWEFEYPASNVTTRGLLVLPAERDAVLRLSSADVIHSLYVPDLGVKQDAFPGQYTRIRTRPTQTGTYRGYCTELCGVGHSRMRADVVVLSQSAYEDWLASHEGESNVTAAPEPRN
ncbi:cytochrome c oxidase subunit II [Halorientalis halophila]|uniref:cytochrome c oxidase subunit II n=1 Tax=Halorientalis halophila TaxID=3108499 RepID=UPI00300BC60B